MTALNVVTFNVSKVNPMPIVSVAFPFRTCDLQGGQRSLLLALVAFELITVDL